MICFSLLMFITLYFYKISFVLPDKPVDLYCCPLHATKIVIPKIMKKNYVTILLLFCATTSLRTMAVNKGIKQERRETCRLTSMNWGIAKRLMR